MIKKIYFLFLAANILSIAAYTQACPGFYRLYVDSSVSVSGTGDTWQTAFKTLNEALYIANNCSETNEIWVRKGTYYPSANGNRQASFNIKKDGIQVYGGFSGLETEFSARNTAANPTILSGNIGAPDTSDNSHHIIWIEGDEITPSTIIDGFIIEGGNNSTEDGGSLLDNVGSAIFNNAYFSESQVSPTIYGCTFRNNYGTAIFNYAYGGFSRLRVTNCVFNNNYGYYGTICNEGSYYSICDAFIDNCTFKNNTSYFGTIFTTSNGGLVRPSITHCIFDNNYVSSSGAAIDNEILDGEAYPSISDCIFTGNIAGDKGGAIANITKASSYNSINNTSVTNCLFNYNYAANSGGAIYTFSNKNSNTIISITNCTITNNYTTNGGGISNDGTGVTRSFIHNSVLFANVASQSGADIYNSGSGTVTKAIVNNSLTQAYDDVNYDNNLIGVNPKFANSSDPDGADNTWFTLDDGFRLLPSSPAFNAGSNSDAENISTDLTGASRIQGGIVDMGAYEIKQLICHSSPIVFVNSSISASGDGTSWSTPYKTLNEALDDANNCTDVNEIWVAKGTYYTTADGSRDSSFRILRNGIKIYGGFAGTETSREQRKPALNKTILSGDIGTAGNNTDNSYHVLTIIATPSSPIDTATRIDGFTIKDGNANVSGSFIFNGNYIVQNRGAGISTFGEGSGNLCKPSITGCVFTNNNSTGDGGAIYNNGYLGNSSPLIVNCVFSSNNAGNGGAIYNYGGYGISSPSITNCTFSANNASNGGAVYDNGNGPGHSTPAITNSVFYGNTASSGADILNSGSGAVPVITYSFTQIVVSGDGNISAAASPFYNAADPDGQDDIFGTADDGLRLKAGSPALNKGINDSLSSGDTLDIRGIQRIQQNIVDMGAYEGATSNIIITLTAAPVKCSSGTTVIKATATGGISPYQYRLNGGNYSATKQFTVPAGTYTVDVKDATGDSTSEVITITQPAPVTVTLAKTDVSCYGQANGSVTVSAGGGTAPYTYRISTVIDYQSSNTFTALTARSYTMYVKDANGCIKSASVSITQPALLKLTAGTKTDVSCHGADGTANVGISGGKAPYQFNIDGGAYQSAGSFTGLTAGAHIVNAKDANDCTASINITLNQAAAVTAILTAKQILCNGGKATITATGGGGKAPYLYKFIDNATGATLVDYQSNRSLSITAGSYKVMVKDSKGCEGTSSVTTVTQPGALQVSVQKTDVSCTGQSDGSATVTGTGGTAPYQYKLGNGAYQSSNTFTGLVKGSYRAYVKDANGCTASFLFSIAKTTNCSMVMARPVEEDKATGLQEFRINAFPNPSAAEFRLLINSNNTAIAEIRVVDIYGREVYKAKGAANNTYHFGKHFVPGSYIVHVMQGKNIRTLKLIKGE